MLIFEKSVLGNQFLGNQLTDDSTLTLSETALIILFVCNYSTSRNRTVLWKETLYEYV